jgi:spore coat protein U-like protein
MKSMFKKLAMGSAFGLVALMGGEQAEAATSTSNLVVTATVLSNCNISANPLGFGSYDPSSASAKTATADLRVDCTNGKAFSIDLGGGANPGASASGVRAMGSVSTGQFLGYQLTYTGAFPHASYTTGSDIGVAQQFVTDAGDGYAGAFAVATDQVYTLNGTIPALQALNPGTDYTDTVVATLTY